MQRFIAKLIATTAAMAVIAPMNLYAASTIADDNTNAYTRLVTANFDKVLDGKHIGLYNIRNRHGMSVSITNYGARIEQILVPDRHDKPGDVVQGYETIDQVINGQGSMGAFIGRYANRIRDSMFTLDGHTYHLSGPSHGGKRGSRFKVFDVKQLANNKLEMRMEFKDGEEGFPGTVQLRVVYELTERNELKIDYVAKATDKQTVVNFTQHPYFNLSGDPGSAVLDHQLMVNAAQVLETDKDLVPTGILRDVVNTPLDFRESKAVGKDIQVDYDLLNYGKGYDNHFVIRQPQPGQLTLDARLFDPKSGRTLEVWSSEPGLQVYSANSLSGNVPRDIGKGARPYTAHSAICLEPSHFPDAPNHANFPSTVLDPGKHYIGHIVYKFSTDRDTYQKQIR